MGKSVLANVASAMVTNIPTLTAEQAIEASRVKREAAGPKPHLVCFYSSYYGGIVTDPAVMSLPLDDHMVGER